MKKIDDSKRIGNYMHTYTGGKYWPFAPDAKDISILDIAASLSNQCRYNGHTNKDKGYYFSHNFYSVAEHSVYVSHQVPRKHALVALMHDAAEAYVGDLIRPLKHSKEFAKPFSDVERINESIIFKKYGLKFPFPKCVKKADESVTAAEVNSIINMPTDRDWDSGHLHDRSKVADQKIKMMLPGEARFFFIDRFMDLTENDYPHLYGETRDLLRQYNDAVSPHRKTS